MVCGTLPFRSSNHDYEVLQNIRRAHYRFPDDLSPECKDLIQRILNPDPRSRAKMSDIEKHPWLQSVYLKSVISPDNFHPHTFSFSFSFTHQPLTTKHTQHTPNTRPRSYTLLFFFQACAEVIGIFI
jgi:serine/threonine protein kinase